MNKNEFIKELGALLQAADERVSEAVLINEDNVLITFANGYEPVSYTHLYSPIYKRFLNIFPVDRRVLLIP